MNQPFLLNCDMGESYGNYQIGNDKALMPYINAANIACGMHAGDPLHIEQTIDLALKHNVQVGAHPGYPDRQGFGRRILAMSQDELTATVRYQVAALDGLTKAKGGRISYVKPHGALYNQMADQPEIARTVVNAILDVDNSLKIMGLADSPIQDIVEHAGATFIAEAFADRRYESNGRLRSRELPQAVIDNSELALKQVLSILDQKKCVTYSGEIIPLEAESFCIHGDNPSALAIAKVLHKQLNDKS